MSAHSTSTSDGTEPDRDPDEVHGGPGLEGVHRDGAAAMAAGGALLLWAATAVRRNARKATLLALAGATLLGLGWHQRRTDRADEATDIGIDVTLGDDADTQAADDKDETGGDDGQDEKKVSDDAHVGGTETLGAGRNADETDSDAGDDEEVNPRGATDRADVESEDDEEFDFVEETEPETHRAPHLENEHDTRLDSDGEGEQTEIDISESAMADETSEAAGPQSEHGYPAMEGTDPEPNSEEVPPRDLEGVDRSGEPDADDDTDDETDDAGGEADDGSEESS